MPLVAELRVPVRELASGIDALYLSGRGRIVEPLWDAAVEAKGVAGDESAEPVVSVAGVEFRVSDRSLGRYPIRLEHPDCVVGLTASEHLPALRVQMRAKTLHAIGPRAAVEWVDATFHEVVEDLRLRTARLDLFYDCQGWVPQADDRMRMVTRARDLDVHENVGVLTGFSIGRRKSGRSGRIYDKTRELKRSQSWYWYEIWGDAFDPQHPVWRVEFELATKALSEFRANRHPVDMLAAAPDLWHDMVTRWCSLRSPTADHTRSRWPVAPEWQAVAAASFASEPIGRERVRHATQLAQMDWLVPRVASELAAIGAIYETDDLDEILGRTGHEVERYDRERATSMAERVAAKRLAYTAS